MTVSMLDRWVRHSNIELTDSEVADAGLERFNDSWCELIPQHAERVISGQAASLLAELRIPNTDLNPILLFRTDRYDLVVDTISVLQAIVASDERDFEVLLSPFRDLAVSGHRYGTTTVLDVNFSALSSISPGESQRRSSMTRQAAMTFANWLPDARGMQGIARLAQSIRDGTKLHLPHLRLPEERIHLSAWRQRDCGLVLAERLQSARRKRWWLGHDEAIVVLSRGKDSGLYIASPFVRCHSATEVRSAVRGGWRAKALEPETVRQLREILHAGATHSISRGWSETLLAASGWR